MKRKKVRLALPVVLAALGLWLLVGCLYVPTFNRVISGKDVGTKVGPGRSKRPIRVGRATRADVVRLLGEPKLVSHEGRRIAYPWVVMKGLTVWPLCFLAVSDRDTQTLLLTFDDNDTLVSYEITHNPDRLMSGQIRPPEPSLPWDFDNPNGGDAPPTTQPTPAP